MVTPVTGVINVVGIRPAQIDKIRTYTGPDNGLISIVGQVPVLTVTTPTVVVIQVAPLTGLVTITGQTPSTATILDQGAEDLEELEELEAQLGWVAVIPKGGTGGTYTEITAIGSTWTAIAAED